LNPGRRGEKPTTNRLSYCAALILVEGTWACIPIGNCEILLGAVCKSPGHACSDFDFFELLSFRHKSILAGDQNVNLPFWNSAVSNRSCEKLLGLFDANEFEMPHPLFFLRKVVTFSKLWPVRISDCQV
jgi:hypothetical protein